MIQKLPNTNANIPSPPPTTKGCGTHTNDFFEKMAQSQHILKKIKLKSPNLDPKKWGSRTYIKDFFEKMTQNHHILRKNTLKFPYLDNKFLHVTKIQ